MPATAESTDWPTHEDGRRKKVGEMTREESRRVFREAAQKLQREFEQPAVQEALAKLLDDGSAS